MPCLLPKVPARDSGLWLEITLPSNPLPGRKATRGYRWSGSQYIVHGWAGRVLVCVSQQQVILAETCICIGVVGHVRANFVEEMRSLETSLDISVFRDEIWLYGEGHLSRDNRHARGIDIKESMLILRFNLVCKPWVLSFITFCSSIAL
jgi:hypothetical protein